MRALMAALALWLAQDHPPRWQLAGAFVRRDSATVLRLLAPDVMVWPPSPDTARRGSAAIGYLQGLALSTRVTRSDLRPGNMSVDGRYLVEEGVWILTSGRTKVSTRYDLRWRQVDGRWRVSFFRWDLFR
jgi:ketosteroid isomerase-like protein